MAKGELNTAAILIKTRWPLSLAQEKSTIDVAAVACPAGASAFAFAIADVGLSLFGQGSIEHLPMDVLDCCLSITGNLGLSFAIICERHGGCSESFKLAA